jgi:PAS domain S-box-containing protein
MAETNSSPPVASAAAELQRLLIERVQDYALFVLDAKGHILTWNPGAERLKGYKAHEIIGKHFSVFYPDDALASGKPAWELEVATAEGRVEDEGWRLRKDGSRFWASVVITALRSDQGELLGFAKVTRDLTDRRRAEEELRESEERFRLLVQGVRDYAIFMLDPSGHIATWNEGAQRLKGYTEREIIGSHFSRFYPESDVKDGKPERELDFALRNGQYSEEGWRIRKDGTRFWASVVITPVRNASGHLAGYAKVTRDLTERIAAQERALTDARRIAAEEAARVALETRADELAALSAQLKRQAAELETRRREAESANRAKGEFLAAMSHELRTPLNAIGGYAELLELGIHGPVTEEQRVALSRIQRSQQHLLGIINDILNFSRIEAGQVAYDVQDFDVQSIVLSVTPMVTPQARAKSIELNVGECAEHIVARADETKVEQVLLNLLSNAVKFTPEGGTIDVLCSQTDGEVSIAVRDTGIGIDEDQLEAVFAPFMQVGRGLATPKEGTGLGLAISRDLARAMGGELNVRSTPGAGSTFTLTLPRGTTAA